MNKFALLTSLLGLIVSQGISFTIYQANSNIALWKTGAIYKFLMPENNHDEDPTTAIFGVSIKESEYKPELKTNPGFDYFFNEYKDESWIFYSNSSFDYETQLRFYVFDLHIGPQSKTITIYIQNVDDESPSLVCPDNLQMNDTVSYDIKSSDCECIVSDPDGFLSNMTFSLTGKNKDDVIMGFPEEISYVEQTARVKIANTTRLDVNKSPIKFTIQAKDGAGHTTVPDPTIDVEINVIHNQ